MPVVASSTSAVIGRRESNLKRVTIDLTPLMPDGENGGAGLVAVSLARELGALAPSIEFTLLTNDRTHTDLAYLDAPNIRRECVVVPTDRGHANAAARAHLWRLGKAVVDRALPTRARARCKDAIWAIVKHRQRARVARSVPADLTFCPFTAPYFFNAGTPLVSIVYDLQHQAYPEFFQSDQRRYRDQHVADACHRAARVVCISDHVRETLLASFAIPPERVVTIHLGLMQTTHGLAQQEAAALLARLRVRDRRFLIYPANFWPHKNHRALIEAHRQFRQAHLDSDLKVVCTGAPTDAMRELAAHAETNSPGGFVFAGYVTDVELASLVGASAALIYPSLYEGFGMPVLEAMAAGKPVLCSNATSLPEVAGDAAVLFDPNSIEEIAAAISAVEDRQDFLATVSLRGPARARTFGSAADMARRYLALFERLVPSGFSDLLV
ncbi:MAG TPA: glycosyltransferase family 1 protein [Chloroflexota bacterium]|nr:glycosyltransferase family 1 protein [Chloroflexota bacterium]